MTGHPFLRVPYHIDEYLPGLDLPLPAGKVITAVLKAGDVWGSLARLYTAVAGYRPELITTRLGLRPVPEERIVLAGARDLDPPEVEYLARAPAGRPRPRSPTCCATCWPPAAWPQSTSRAPGTRATARLACQAARIEQALPRLRLHDAQAYRAATSSAYLLRT